MFMLVRSIKSALYIILCFLIGVGATIGTVFASLTHVSPYAVGADIGCGMIAAPIDGLTVNNLKEKMEKRDSTKN